MAELEAQLIAQLDELRRIHDLGRASFPHPTIAQIPPDSPDIAALKRLVSENDIVEVVDHFDALLEELFYCRHPALKEEVRAGNPEAIRGRDEFISSHLGESHPWATGSWVFLPWRRTLIRLLSDDLHQELRTARNRGWIEADEQAVFRNLVVGIVGLSVGSNIALTLAQEGGPRRMKLADPDQVAGTNLNRIRGTFADLAVPKTHLAAQQIYELDPYAELILFTDGLSRQNVEHFLDDPPRLGAVIDECDDPIMKIVLRVEAKARGIPLLMATDMGDDVILDVERYDLDPEYPLLHGRLGPDKEKWIDRELTPQENLQLLLTFLGLDSMPPRMLSIGQRLGKDLDGPPQLGGTCLMAGAAVSHALRRISADRDPMAGRFRATVTSIPSSLSG